MTQRARERLKYGAVCGTISSSEAVSSRRDQRLWEATGRWGRIVKVVNV